VTASSRRVVAVGRSPGFSRSSGRNTGYHLEFTRKVGHRAGKVLTVDIHGIRHPLAKPANPSHTQDRLGETLRQFWQGDELEQGGGRSA
jgi:hypothetical protein